MSLAGLARLTRDKVREALPDPLLSRRPLLESWGFHLVLAMVLLFLFSYLTVSTYYSNQNCTAVLKATGLSQQQVSLLERVCR